MAISDLKARQGKVELIANVVKKEDVREFNKEGRSGKVCNAIVEDPTGQVKLTLWNEQCDLVGVGDKVQISNGYVGEWQGELQLSTGKFGTLAVLEKGAAVEQKAEEKPAKKEEPKKSGMKSLDSFGKEGKIPGQDKDEEPLDEQDEVLEEEGAETQFEEVKD